MYGYVWFKARQGWHATGSGTAQTCRLVFSSVPLCSRESFLCHFSWSTFRWWFQGEENYAEDISSANLLACYDNAQSKILGLRRRSLYTDGLDWVRSLRFPCYSCLVFFACEDQSLILGLVFGSLTGFSWPAEAMGSCWSCLYRDPIRDNHLTKFKVGLWFPVSQNKMNYLCYIKASRATTLVQTKVCFFF